MNDGEHIIPDQSDKTSDANAPDGHILEAGNESDRAQEEHDASGTREGTADDKQTGKDTVWVRLRAVGEMVLCQNDALDVVQGERVVVETNQGPAVGTVVCKKACKTSSGEHHKLLRRVDEHDQNILERNRTREKEAFQFCEDCIRSQKLPMKLIDVQFAHSGTRAVFHFSSGDRVDFRELVRELARRFHTRIEMRQVGIRDAARHTGGIGICGRELCCASWLTSFRPISIRMAKDQNLTLNQKKLSGLCSRLHCCLDYEQELYRSQRKALPKVGKRVITPQGEGRVKDVDVLSQRLRVRMPTGELVVFAAAEVKRIGDVQAKQSQAKDVAKQQGTPGEQKTEQPPSDGAKPSKKRKRRRRKKRRPRGGQKTTNTDQKQGTGPKKPPA